MPCRWSKNPVGCEITPCFSARFSSKVQPLFCRFPFSLLYMSQVSLPPTELAFLTPIASPRSRSQGQGSSWTLSDAPSAGIASLGIPQNASLKLQLEGDLDLRQPEHSLRAGQDARAAAYALLRLKRDQSNSPAVCEMRPLSQFSRGSGRPLATSRKPLMMADAASSLLIPLLIK